MVVTRLEPSGLSHKVVPVPLKMTGSDSEETQRSDDSLGSSKFFNDKVEKNLIDHVGVLDNVVPGSPKLKGYGKAPMFVKSSIQLTMKIQGIPECLSKPMSCSQPSTTPQYETKSKKHWYLEYKKHEALLKKMTLKLNRANERVKKIAKEVRELSGLITKR